MQPDEFSRTSNALTEWMVLHGASKIMTTDNAAQRTGAMAKWTQDHKKELTSAEILEELSVSSAFRAALDRVRIDCNAMYQRTGKDLITTNRLWSVRHGRRPASPYRNDSSQPRRRTRPEIDRGKDFGLHLYELWLTPRPQCA